MAELDKTAIQAELDRMKHQVAARSAAAKKINQAVETIADANADIMASDEATIGSIEAIEALLEGEEPSLPVLDLHDALPVRAGEVAYFQVTLSRPSEEAVTAEIGSGTSWTPLEVEPGVVEGPVPVSTSGKPPGALNVSIRNSVNATIGSATATGTILPSTDGGEVGPVEPVDGSKPQIKIGVGTAPRQSWWGYGYGVGSFNGAPAAFPKFQANVKKLCEDMDASVIRFMTPENTSKFLAAYKPFWDLVKNHGIDTVFSSSFTLSGGVSGANPTGCANGIDAAMKAGVTPARWAATLENEPDAPNTGDIDEYSQALLDHQITFRNRLNALGRGAVITLGLEWRHTQQDKRGRREFDMAKARGLIGTGLGEYCYHIYDKSADEGDYDQRWLKHGLGAWSTETGYMNSPNAVVRFMCGVNHGSVVELAHQAIASKTDENDNERSQKLLRADGQPNPWYHAPAALSRALTRGTVMRLCTSDKAGRMKWNNWAVPHAAICGRRPDGKWLVAACTMSGAAQMTVTVPELQTSNRVLAGQRVSQGGGVSTAKANMQGGLVRFTLADRETIVLVG